MTAGSASKQKMAPNHHENWFNFKVLFRN